ncbi:ABC-three component system middle component 1 [Fictibacillus terranigra]|uniref:Uncharacterized protein n=1 Tax=Fictibacillus terranigra TaxID=3058424 RepID=A0ABT8EDA9_9BACL|nr:ABC-three component system middle component 1 [Fictibacillus sp. CENA-BCM004]MDN4075852.1 hypothetical protein [Fictibacillus sp. CENA-BCM004]
MKLNTVKDYLHANGYSEKPFMKKSAIINSEGKREISEINILPFKHIFISQSQKEVYILEEKECLFTSNELEKMDNLILTFIQFLSNKDAIKYNINLVLLCPFNKKQDQKELQKMLGFERNKYTCRKIFLDTSSKDFSEEMAILPSFPLDVHLVLKSTQIDSLSNKIKEVMDDNLYSALLKDAEELTLNQVLVALNSKGEAHNE